MNEIGLLSGVGEKAGMSLPMKEQAEGSGVRFGEMLQVLAGPCQPAPDGRRPVRRRPRDRPPGGHPLHHDRGGEGRDRLRDGDDDS